MRLYVFSQECFALTFTLNVTMAASSLVVLDTTDTQPLVSTWAQGMFWKNQTCSLRHPTCWAGDMDTSHLILFFFVMQRLFKIMQVTDHIGVTLPDNLSMNPRYLYMTLALPSNQPKAIMSQQATSIAGGDHHMTV